MRNLLIVSTLIKLLLIPAYRSTDFEVHRNWLAITHSLPISQWYIENTSEWTLDYPPFFAWFEKCLSVMGALVDPNMVKIENLGYESTQTILFQRLTVIASELVLYWALVRYARYFGNKYVNWMIVGSLFMHPGLIIVDHIHFQYNGLLYGILILSIVEAKRNNLLRSGALFSILLNFKHIYLYMAPAYFVYLLKVYCFVPETNKKKEGIHHTFSLRRLVVLGSTVVCIFVISFGPFVYLGQIPQLLGRLFPFTRGLCHAYWAPNFWALYAGLDRVLIIFGKRFGWSLNQEAITSMTRGYVGDTQFAVLPTVEAIHTMIITVLVQMIVLQKLWRKPTFDNFLASLTLCGFASYLFGWHVHEKAIMIVLIPYGLMAAYSKVHLRVFVILSASGIFSLYPLLFHATETPIKIAMTLLWFCAVLPGLAYSVNTPLKHLLYNVEQYYVIGLFFLQAYTGCLHDMIFGSDRLEFLPLMMTSLYCAIGIVYGWGLFMWHYLSH
ncbi:glycosyltransferase family 57 protein [Gilbertella persicaria]|uniref:glycosyltransferase family 57 protein n=1 Tax=Gilbertella persicaria TaxID=101096 RepID=UPI002221088D|nr:glycosyltransferase family 57 protein [Gilbertella persicaria]KAI8053182.1 glycosyltransferase family 57 protein [Gilbertella persicaria]